MPTERYNHHNSLIPSFGECIYCGALANDVELHDEHVIQFALGGKLTILNGSCKECAKRTADIEGELGRKVYWDFRIHTNAPTRRKKERPTERPFLISVDNGPPEQIYAPIKDHPYFTFLPAWGVAGLLNGEQPTSEFPDAEMHIFSWQPPNMREIAGVPAGVPFQIIKPTMDINADKFARAIAKIAYCQAIVNYGLHGFRRLMLPDLILGKYPHAPYLVGAVKADPPPRTSTDIRHVVAIGETQIGSMRLLVAALRIFSNAGTDQYGAPVYHAIVGAPLAGRRLAGRREPQLALGKGPTD